MKQLIPHQVKKGEVGRLLVSCVDQPGITMGISRFLNEQGANLSNSEQYVVGDHFFLRVEFRFDDLSENIEELRKEFARIAEPFEMEWRMIPASRKHRMAIFVSKADHCLEDLLWRWRNKELDAEITMVVSNHLDLKPLVEPYGIPYYHIPVTKETREEAARKQAELLQAEKIDTIVLARYMQIIPNWMVKEYKNRMINIHHSFLPAFEGAKPYHRAYDRGVKLVGATAHYVTSELDKGPIIEQDVQRISHLDTVRDIVRIGKDTERLVLARAVRWHLNDRVWVTGNKTIVFSGT
ncbi:formyltetrahydrofolate deformylase [Thermoflavimicrobium daqui]|jgi:formyltetrahydrofolate deformylase|uniref:Formyltetrahydrofolate deformylase n=1 Tax=Thermoflavimicrobium daqui TaxID=2137476 RepID=A0A364K0U1_9BACL|nr:formyltetrahydrofolate deformylase [Thermoflavimicrobium daqui]RAL21309.1 formyltetrahydrofolate deformylase [Thermoflavimicrobium daqui]